MDHLGELRTAMTLAYLILLTLTFLNLPESSLIVFIARSSEGFRKSIANSEPSSENDTTAATAILSTKSGDFLKTRIPLLS